MRLLKSLFLLALPLSFFTACDIIDGPKKDYTNLANASERVVLLEEFTGHKCGSCPSGHAKSKELKGLYPDNVISVAIHAGGFATVGPNPFYGDYRTIMGTELDDYYDADQAGYPKGMVNRKMHSGSALLGVADWGTWVGQEIALPASMILEVHSVFDSLSREIAIEVDIEYLTVGTADDNLVVWITEDSIMGPQKDYSLTPDLIPVYTHMDMLRATVTPGTWGQYLKSSPIAIGEKFTQSFVFNLDAAYNAKNCHVVAYVMNNSSKEIYQAAEVHVIE